ncbi:hypothetical protein RclHR1_16490001 [Rhizophagus clarus]|uniref:Uncharacterized protein n=1 Tax=Rhizophagus clarus TaxID=94130 RepID=A0A2Z6QYC7_9GLOM|nr:hypothetical protein RclHR1_16490001 [Rhizophagus clarus]
MSKKDYRQLQELMLNTYKWNLLDKLIELFKPIEDATEFLENDNNNDENSDNENNDDENNDEDSDEFDNDGERNSTDSINSIDEQIDITTIINTIKEEIYNALYDYFDNPPNATILASILDPKSKQMHWWLEELKEKTSLLLKSEYEEQKQEESLRETNTHFQVNHKCKTFASRIFGFSQS